MSVGAPVAANTAGAGDLRVQSYVLPVGAAKPSLQDLQSGEGMQRLRDLAAQAEPGARMPLGDGRSGGLVCAAVA